MLTKKRDDNQVLRLKLMVVATLMFGFAWALIPLYRVICEETGFNQKRSIVEANRLDKEEGAGGVISLTFDATVQAGLPWEVRPVTRHIRARRGEFVKVEYDITNASERTVIGRAIPRYLPAAAGNYIKKLDCFCFRNQTFAPRQTRRLPVVFVLDKATPESVTDITLAYTVFDVPDSAN